MKEYLAESFTSLTLAHKTHLCTQANENLHRKKNAVLSDYLTPLDVTHYEWFVCVCVCVYRRHLLVKMVCTDI